MRVHRIGVFVILASFTATACGSSPSPANPSTASDAASAAISQISVKVERSAGGSVTVPDGSITVQQGDSLTVAVTATITAAPEDILSVGVCLSTDSASMNGPCSSLAKDSKSMPGTVALQPAVDQISGGSGSQTFQYMHVFVVQGSWPTSSAIPSNALAYQRIDNHPVTIIRASGS